MTPVQWQTSHVAIWDVIVLRYRKVWSEKEDIILYFY